MQISAEKIKEFQTLYKQELGVLLDDETAAEYGMAIVQLVEAIIEPNEYVKRNKHKKNDLGD